MSETPAEPRDGPAVDAATLIARAAAAEARAQPGLTAAIDDFFLPDEARLDEQSRAALAALLGGLVATVEGEVREHAVRRLEARGETQAAKALGNPRGSVLARLRQAGLLRDPDLMAELMARVRQELLGAALPAQAPDDPERPSLINRFVDHPDRILAAGAMALLIAESRRRSGADAGLFTCTGLPAELHRRLVWSVAAALRGRVDAGGEAADAALGEAARRSIAAHDEGDRLEAVAMRLAAAIDAPRHELPALLVESLGDRCLVLFIALLAQALGVDYALAREIVLEPAGDRLWPALRALDIGREPIARIGHALCEADPRRDLDAFADALDAIAALPVEDALKVLGALRLDPAYRAALRALGSAGKDA